MSRVLGDKEVQELLQSVRKPSRLDACEAFLDLNDELRKLYIEHAARYAPIQDITLQDVLLDSEWIGFSPESVVFHSLTMGHLTLHLFNDLRFEALTMPHLEKAEQQLHRIMVERAIGLSMAVNRRFDMPGDKSGIQSRCAFPPKGRQQVLVFFDEEYEDGCCTTGIAWPHALYRRFTQ